MIEVNKLCSKQFSWSDIGETSHCQRKSYQIWWRGTNWRQKYQIAPYCSTLLSHCTTLFYFCQIARLTFVKCWCGMSCHHCHDNKNDDVAWHVKFYKYILPCSQLYLAEICQRRDIQKDQQQTSLSVFFQQHHRSWTFLSPLIPPGMSNPQ